MTKKIFYEKVGRKYIPVAEYDSEYLDSFPKGNHLVMVYPGGSSRRFNIEPNYAALIAAGRVAEDAICNAIVESQKLRPQREPITEEQRALWKALAKSFDREDLPLIRPAARDAAEAAIKAMQEEADTLMSHPSVKQAFDHFITIANLCRTEN